MSRRAIANIAAVLLLALLAWRQFGGALPDVLPIPIVVDPKPGSWVVILEESEDRTPEVAKLIADATWLDGIKARQAKFRVYDDDQPEAASYVRAAGDKRPAVLIVAPDGTLLGQSDVVTRQSISDLLKAEAGL